MSLRGKTKRSAPFPWTDEKKVYLIECWHALTVANDARLTNKLNKKQLSDELRIEFCERYSECELASTSLYRYVKGFENDRLPVPVAKNVASTATAVQLLPPPSAVRSFWNVETDEFLVECVVQARQDNTRAIKLGLQSGKRGRPSAFRKILIDLFTNRYPNVSHGYIFNRVTQLRKQKRIDDVVTASSSSTTSSSSPLVPFSSSSVTNANANAGDVSIVTDESAIFTFYQCAMRYWEIGYQFSCKPIFVAACSYCSAIMTSDSTKNYRKFLQNPNNSDGSAPAQSSPNVYKYYTRAQVKLPVTNATGQLYYCILCKNVDLLAKYPLAPNTVRYLPLPKCVAALTDPADRRSIALVALHSRTATQRSDALRIFEHLRGEFAVSHQDDKRYFTMYAMIVDRFAQHTTTTTRTTGNARILVQRALKWLKINNPLYRMFAANYETLLRYQPRKPGQPKTLQLFGNVDFKPVSTGLTKISLLDSEQSGMIVPAGNVGTRGVSSVADTVTGAQHVRDYQTATRGYADVCQVTFGDPYLEAKLFPWLLPYGSGGWSVNDGKRGITRGMYIRWRTSMCDQRFRREPEYMFFFLDLIIKERMQYYASVRVNVSNLEAPLTKQQIDTAAKRAKNDPYVLQYGTEVPASIPNSRNYWATKTLDLLAMSAQMGRQPDFFITLTENDSWPELQAVICRGLAAAHQGADRKEFEDIHRFGRPAMNHPLETVHAFYNRLQMFRRRVLNNHTGPIGHVQDYFLRIEYQKRGSLHAHLVVWVEPGSVVPEDVVSAEMPRYNEHPMNPTWRHIVESYQLHRCIPRRCLKGKKNKQLTRCKYGFPFAVNRESVRPAATGVRFVYKRHAAEDARVIPYNLPLILLWDGHINIQMVTTGGWELYLAKYVVKSDQATMMSIHSTKTTTTNDCETYLKGRLVSLLEAATLIQQKPHVMSTREVVYLPVASSPMYRILKRSADMQNLNENDTNLYYDTKLEKYLDRPKQLNHLTYPQFYEQYYYNQFQNDNEIVVDCNDDDDDDDGGGGDGVNIDGKQKNANETITILKDRKGRTLRKRQNRLAIVRFPHFSPYGINLEKYCLVKLLRHVPVDRVTFDELKTRTGSYLQECLDRNLIEATDEATHFLESAAKQGFSLDRLREIASRLMAGNWLADQDVDKLLETVAPYHMHADKVRRGLITDDADGYAGSTIPGGNDDTDDGLNVNVRKYLPVSDYLQAFTTSQLGAFERITGAWNENQQVLAFITGGGGVGKSFLLDALVAYCNENGRTVQKLATTGCAAHLIGGVTIHSYLRMGPELISRIERGTVDAYLLERTQVLFIDEVSMLEQNVMEKLEYYIDLFSSITNNNNNNDTSSFTASKNIKQQSKKLRFAGKSLIMFGDPCQLPPIGRHIWQPVLLRGFHVMVLKEAVRQRDDHGFADMLRRIRLAQPTPDDIEILRSRLVTDEQLRDIDVTARGGLILFPLRRQKDAMNAVELAKLPLDSERMYQAQDGHVGGEGPLPKKVRDYIAILDGKNKLMPQCVRLRLGARVMLLKNRNVEHGWVNGKIAIVDSMSDNYVVISDPGKPQRQLVVHRLRQDIAYPYTDGQYFREQFPLDLAYGVTIHKSQGQTLDVVAVSAEGLRNSGQFYTAISRARELDGLYFLSFEAESIYLYPDIRTLIDWFNVVDCLQLPHAVAVRNDDGGSGGRPQMPTVGQLTYRQQNGSCLKQPVVPITTLPPLMPPSKLPQPMPQSKLPPTPPPPPPPLSVAPVVVVDESNVESYVRNALQAVSLIPINLSLREYVSEFHKIAAQHPWTSQWVDEIAHRQKCAYDARNTEYQIDQGRTDRFYYLFAEEQGYIIATQGDNSCLFHAFSLVLFGHQRHDMLFRFLCCIIFARYNCYYNVNSNRLHLEYDNVQQLIRDTAACTSDQRSWGGAAHLTAIAQIARRDIYVYNADIDEKWRRVPIRYLQEAIDRNEMRGSMHIRYESREPPFNNHQPLTLLLTDAGTNASHYSAILPISATLHMLKPAVVLPPQR